ncbi:MAG: peptidoglycan DD-metalloendopeptidase family protein [Candidatus Nanopelagicales bacterium]|nr:peptidoglycan DD-metalloendopeptidase family protein [Candidatus Nanopelagicales bacterium]MCU0296193.1 peptidoglycan DD-metalloendopeptidase family protein [Candidatus Nanopelagicales bacterium]MCU0299613.1 peptidoglycan DD-metalloendopeptidase family protein [Candidatus Nanopelagicales bacterium]
MSRRPSRRARYVAASMVIGLGLGYVGLPVQAEDINEQVEEALDDLASADKKVAAAIGKLDAAKQNLPAARKELAQAQAELTSAQERKAVADRKVAVAIAKVAQAKQEIAETEQQIAFLEQRIGQMARQVYTQGGVMSEVEILLDASDPGDFASRMETLRSIAQGNNNTLTDLGAAKAQLNIRLASLKTLEVKAEEAQAEAEALVAEAADAKAKADAAKAKIDELVAARASALRDAKQRREAVKKQYRQYKAEQERIAAIARAAAAKASQGQAGVPINIGADGLAWPTPGASVGQNVGPRIHPVYGYRSCHTGTDISAGQGAPIYSAADGVVISVENGGPFGLHTLIQHGSGISTMYAHQSVALVSAGQKVKQGQLIGRVGTTGWVTGPHLHYEVHVNGTPYDPMGWYGGAKVPVRC